jgi:hypothetical protein
VVRDPLSGNKAESKGDHLRSLEKVGDYCSPLIMGQKVAGGEEYTHRFCLLMISSLRSCRSPKRSRYLTIPRVEHFMFLGLPLRRTVIVSSRRLFLEKEKSMSDALLFSLKVT